MAELHQSLRGIPMPERVKRLPLTDNGFPVLFFAMELNGKPDLRIADARKLIRCIKERLCWVCGEKLGVHMAFVLGPMCCITRTTSEPPTHYDCATYAVKACPFLTRPHMHRREAGMPEERSMPGFAIERNPGVAAVWVTRSYKPFRPHLGGDGILINVGPPERCEFWCEGRQATYVEVVESIESGAPALYQIALKDKDQEASLRALTRQLARFLPLLHDLPGREARPAEGAGLSTGALLSARALEAAWFSEHPDADSFVRQVETGESPVREATHVLVTKLDPAAVGRRRDYGMVDARGEFKALAQAE